MLGRAVYLGDCDLCPGLNIWRWLSNDTEKSLSLKELYYLHFPRGGTHHAIQIHGGSPRFGQEVAQSLRCVFHGTDRAGQGKWHRIWLAWVMWAGSGLQVQSPVVWYLALGDLVPGKYWPGVEGVVGDMDLGLVRGFLIWLSLTHKIWVSGKI